MSYFFSMQFSAIQKMVLRHNRLWSIAGISQGLSHLNEIVFPQITADNNGEVMVAGGGKFTAFFPDELTAETARTEIIKQLVSMFPMLEFQASKVVKADQFRSGSDSGGEVVSAKDAGIIDQLSEDKRIFRGYGTSFLPHLAVCEECGEFPAEEHLKYREGKRLCRICSEAWNRARGAAASEAGKQTTLEKIYAKYFAGVKTANKLGLLYDFEDLFPEEENRGRMAVWFSDLNNMNQKVPIWLDQDDEKVFETFNKVKNINIEVVAEALVATFNNPVGTKLPFRLIVAGGDDLCLVMAEEYILNFAQNLDLEIRKKVEALDQDSENPLNTTWLLQHAKKDNSREKKEIGPYSFGASFIVASIHTPFKRIHELGEDLMKTAKESTERQGNSVNWRIMAEKEAVSDSLLAFERPLFISREKSRMKNGGAGGWAQLSLSDYLGLRKKFSTAPNNISSSHRFAIISKMIELRENRREVDFENWLKCYDSGERDKSFSGLLREPLLRHGETLDGALLPSRIATLFELLAIKNGN